MSDITAVVSPLVDVRDVLETFRRHRIFAENWVAVLSDAATALDQASVDALAAPDMTHLVAQLRMLLINGLQANIDIVDSVADEAQHILSGIRIPGIPRPEDEHWEFV
ncbi:MAG: hypothetical protein ACRDRA_11655 [Pseudonocardiaceae bacterium]